AHETQVLVRLEPEGRERAVQQLAVLARREQVDAEERIAAQREHDRRRLHRLGTGADDGEDLERLHASSTRGGTGSPCSMSAASARASWRSSRAISETSSSKRTRGFQPSRRWA